MTKKKAAYQVNVDWDEIFSAEVETQQKSDALTVQAALDIVVRQMKAAGLRERTIHDYQTHVSDFDRASGGLHLDELTADHLYAWLSKMNVSNATKLIRLKCVKAFLGRCFKNGWFERNFWDEVKIRVDTPVKEGATDRDVKQLLSYLDLSDFSQLRDAVAVLTMYQTGVRIGTLVKLETKHVDLKAKMFKIGGELVKNHEPLYLPFDDVLASLLAVLIKQNALVRREHRVRNDLLFITIKGTEIETSPTHNNIRKRLNKYAKMYGLKNINPHALRRGFAKNLLKKGADLTLISKALGHSDLAVTTRYLHLGREEVADNLRKFL